jgi:hypothetical protein
MGILAGSHYNELILLPFLPKLIKLDIISIFNKRLNTSDVFFPCLLIVQGRVFMQFAQKIVIF